MTKYPSTPGQAAVLNFMRTYLAENGLPPTQAEIAAGVGVTERAVQGRIKSLAAAGLIVSQGKHRSRTWIPADTGGE